MSSWSRALITGASTGIGEEFARILAERGTDLVLVARSADKLEALASELGESQAVTVEVLPADLTDETALAKVEARLADSGAPVDLLVNNAGFGNTGTFADLSVDVDEDQIRLNVLALVRLTHAALNAMHSRDGDRGIINVSSVAGSLPGPGTATYSATKAFVTSFTESVHEEELEHGVVVTALLPGPTPTEFQETASYDTSGVPGFIWTSARAVAEAGLHGLERGRVIVTPGLSNRAAIGLVRFVPRRVARWAATRITRR